MRIVLLEHPRILSAVHFNDIANTPLWSCLMTGYVASSLLEKGFRVDVIDATRVSFPVAARSVIETPSELLLVHAVYFWERTNELFEMLAALRKNGYGGVICLFGFFPTLAWKDILDSQPEVDCVVVGEPEETIVEFAMSLDAWATTRIAGLASRSLGKVTLPASRAPIVPLDELPFPLRGCLEPEDTVSVLASRGCYNGCSFCLVPTLDGGSAVWRSRSSANIFAEIESLVARGQRNFYFADPNFIGPGKAGRDHALDLCARLSGLGITFGMETRANDITPQLMVNLGNAGLRSLLLGLESGSAGVLKRLAKRTTVAQNERAVATVREYGIEPEIGFIMFEPASTLEDINENLMFLERNRLLDRLGRTANLLYHSHIAFKGTPGYNLALEQGMLVPEGLYGFEGRLLYRDGRVGWLAGIMRSICHFILMEMSKSTSPILWSAENRIFQAVNDRLVETFKQLLKTASHMEGTPEPAWTGRETNNAIEELKGEWS